MTLSGAVIRNHIDYNCWATGRLLEAAEDLTLQQREHDFGTATGSVAGTLTHLFQSERLWLRRIQGKQQSFAQPGDEQWNTLYDFWPAIQGEWREWAATLSDEDSDRNMDYPDLKGHPRSNPLWQTVLHMVNHSTHHRGQVAGFLRALGVAPPALDFIVFTRS